MMWMNTLFKNSCAKAVVAPTGNPANLSPRIFVAEDGVVIRQFNAGLREGAV